MVDGGFITLNPKDAPIKGFAPPSNWREHPQEWIIPYTRPGAVATFVLRCSLQEATGRLFIHASETGPDNMPRRENIQVLGLQLANYTSKERCESNTWEDVIQNERTLMEMFREFVSRPLWESAQRDLGVDEEDAENAGGNGVIQAATPRGKGILAGSSSEGKEDSFASPSSRVGVALESMNSLGVTRRNMLIAAAVGSGAAMAFFLYKNHKETGKYIPAGVERLLPAFVRE
jgi:hypothetical protein